MQPTLLVGDVVVSRPISPTTPLRVGQIILEQDPDHVGWLRLHRLVHLAGNGDVVTKGDANAQPDSSRVPTSGVVGIAALHIPYLGVPAVWVQTRQGGDLAALAAAALLLAACAFLFRDGDNNGDETNGSPPPMRWRRASGRTQRRPSETARTAPALRQIAIVGVTGLVLGLVPASPASAAAFSTNTANPADTFATASRFACSDRVIADAPANYYLLNESSGTVAADSSGNNHPGTYSSTGVSYGVTGPCAIDGATAITLNGGATTGITTANAVERPSAFTAEIWFKTSTTSGGMLLGMYDSATGTGGQPDPVMYLQNSGQVDFGMFDGSSDRTTASPSAYNDGAWHLVDATYTASAGMTLFVDGISVATLSGAEVHSFIGYWRIGYGGLSGWPNAPNSPGFADSLASAVIYPQVLSNTQIAQNYGAMNG